MRTAQISLKFQFIAVMALAVLFRSAVFVGWTSLAWISGLSLLVVLLCFAWAVAPRAMNHALAVLGIGAVCFSILVCWIDQSRTLARQQRCGENLRRFGLGFQERRDFACPPVELNSPAAVDQIVRDSLYSPGYYTFPLPATD